MSKASIRKLFAVPPPTIPDILSSTEETSLYVPKEVPKRKHDDTQAPLENKKLRISDQNDNAVASSSSNGNVVSPSRRVNKVPSPVNNNTRGISSRSNVALISSNSSLISNGSLNLSSNSPATQFNIALPPKKNPKRKESEIESETPLPITKKLKPISNNPRTAVTKAPSQGHPTTTIKPSATAANTSLSAIVATNKSSAIETTNKPSIVTAINKPSAIETIKPSPIATNTLPSAPSQDGEVISFIDSILAGIKKEAKTNQSSLLPSPAGSPVALPTSPVNHHSTLPLRSRSGSSPRAQPGSPPHYLPDPNSASPAAVALPPPLSSQTGQSSQGKLSNKEKKKLARQRKRNKKFEKAANATINHVDKQKCNDDLDFDALLQQHEAATKKSQSAKKPQRQSNINNQLPNDLATAAAAATAAAQSLATSNALPGSTNQHQNKPEKHNKPHQRNKPYQHSKPQQQIKPQHNNKKKFVPTVVCNYYMKGNCKEGDNCTFKHEGKPAPPPQSNIVCQFFKTGSCCAGSECKFSHDLKLEPCRFYHMSDGKCQQGYNCPYSHEPLNDDTLSRLRKLTGPCRFYNFKGYCNTGDYCKFSHDEPSEEEKKKVEATITACYFYHVAKKCSQGDDCFYLHDEATSEQVEQIRKAGAPKK